MAKCFTGGGHNYAGTDRDLLCRRTTMFRKESESVKSGGELLEILKAVCILGSSLLIKKMERESRVCAEVAE